MFIEKTKTEKIFSFFSPSAVSLAVAVACLVLSVIFPVQNEVENLTKNIFFLVMVPVLYIKYILKKNVADFGFNLHNVKSGIFWGVGLMVFLALFTYLLMHYTAFDSYHKIPAAISDNFWFFVLYELVFVNIYTFTTDFFYKGFLLFSLSPRWNIRSVIIIAVIQLIFLLIARQTAWLVISSVVLMIAGSFVAYKTRSFFYSYFANILFSIILDAYIIHAVK